MSNPRLALRDRCQGIPIDYRISRQTTASMLDGECQGYQKAFVQLFKADIPSKGIALCNPEDIEALKEIASFSK